MSNEDWEVLEQALQSAIAVETDDEQMRVYRQVLKRLHAGHEQTKGAALTSGTAGSLDDGFRYDYDDASDLYDSKPNGAGIG